MRNMRTATRPALVWWCWPPDVAQASPTEEVVNEALRLVIRLAQISVGIERQPERKWNPADGKQLTNPLEPRPSLSVRCLYNSEDCNHSINALPLALCA